MTSGRAGAAMGFVFLSGLVLVIALIARFLADARVPNVVFAILGVIIVLGAVSLFTGRPRE